MNKTSNKRILTHGQQQEYALSRVEPICYIIHRLVKALFISVGETDRSDLSLYLQLCEFEEQLQSELYNLLSDKAESQQQAAIFLEALPGMYIQLLIEGNTLLLANPKAQDLSEIFASPKFFTIAVHRFACQLCSQGIPLLPRLLSKYVRTRTTVDNQSKLMRIK